MEVQFNQIQEALDDCLQTWAEEVERGGLFRENTEENTLGKYAHWYRSTPRRTVELVLAILFSLSVCNLLMGYFLS